MHTHSFVEIAVAVGGTAVHHSLAGRREMRPGDVLLLRPGVWHGYEDCQRFEVYNCCFSSELLRRELAWTREDPLLGFLLWAGPYSSPGRGVLTISLDPPALAQCLVHLDALAGLRHRPPALHRPDIVGRLSLLFGQFGQFGQAVAQDRGALSGEPGTAHPAVVRAMSMLETDLARDWKLTGLAAELHLAPGYLVRLFNAATGLPPMAFLAQLRAEHAAVLLLHTGEPVTRTGGRSAGPTRACSPAASRPTTGSAPPPTASASRPGPPTCTSRQPRRGGLLNRVPFEAVPASTGDQGFEAGLDTPGSAPVPARWRAISASFVFSAWDTRDRRQRPGQRIRSWRKASPEVQAAIRAPVRRIPAVWRPCQARRRGDEARRLRRTGPPADLS